MTYLESDQLPRLLDYLSAEGYSHLVEDLRVARSYEEVYGYLTLKKFKNLDRFLAQAIYGDVDFNVDYSMTNKIYAGIGSRETPEDILKFIEDIAFTLAKKDWTLRSGGAPGADLSFEIGANGIMGCKKEIYLPWKNFNSNPSPLYTCTVEAMDLAKKFHKGWGYLTDAAKKLMARNCYQVLGKDLKSPVDCIICWTRDGKATGGTGQAIRIADHYGIRVYNLKHDAVQAKFKQLVYP